MAALGWMDYVTGFEISFSFFYLLPISITAWYIGLGNSLVITAISILTWLISNWLAGENYSSEWIRFFNFGVRLIVFSLIAYILDALKNSLKTERVIARTDYLTGAFNRREFIDKLGMEIERTKRVRIPISLAVIDLDNFKLVNDELGHSAGDRHLKLVSQTISNNIRKTDLFARLGGDEFGLFLPNVSQQDAKMIVEKIDRAVLKELRGQHSHVTLSMGVITYNTPPASAEEMIHQADLIMYQAKQAGKRRSVFIEME